jgi:nucleotide sugar dehydrogenase
MNGEQFLPTASTTVGGNGHFGRGVYPQFVKPILDFVVGLALAVTTLPVQAVLAILSWAAFGRPPMRAERAIGKGGKPFRLLRLRSCSNGQGTFEKGWRGRYGRIMCGYSLNELPQLWNVVAGQMSLVGPRPLPVGTELAEWQQQRFAVRPGLTGLWQVEARGDGRKLLDNIHYDIQYLDQISLVTDALLISRTAGAVLFRREGDNPAPPNGNRVRDRFPHIRLISTDLSIWLVALVLGHMVRFDFSWSSLEMRRVIPTFAIAACVQLAYGYTSGLYRGRWRLASFEETSWVGTGTAVVTLTLMVLATSGLTLIARGGLAAAGAFHFVGALVARHAARAIYTAQTRSIHRRPHRLIVVGAGEAGLNAVRAIWTDEESEFEPVALLDDDPAKHGFRFFSLMVVGTSDDLPEVARRYAADSLLVAMPSAPTSRPNDIVEIGRRAGLRVQVLPPLVDSLTRLLVDHARRTTGPESPYEPSRRPVPSGKQRGRKHREYDLAIIGLGYVGLPVAVAASQAGVKVLGLDIDRSKVDSINNGISYLEDVSSEDLAAAADAGFLATTDSAMLAQADAITISVPTPLRDELPDLSAVIAATEAIGDYLEEGQLVILESTTYPGTTEEVVRPILEERSGLTAGIDFYLAYSPERIDPGNPEWRIHNTPKLVGGINEASTQQAAILYQKFSPVVSMSGTKEAEMAKLLENTYRHVNIALVNEMAIFCQQLGVDIWETIRGAATKPFGFQAFYPGPGVGGHCIPIDPNYLSYRVRQLGEQFRFVELAQEINSYMPRYVADRAIKMLENAGKIREQSTVLLVGVTYKPDVADVRETTAIRVASELIAAGATVEWVDPHAKSFGDGLPLTRRQDPVAAAKEADLVLIHTAHSSLDLGEICDAARMVLDTRGVVDSEKARRL